MRVYYFLIVLCTFLLASPQLDAQIYLISDGGTINTCTGTLYDSGGAGSDYSNNEQDTITFCSDVPGDDIFLNVVFFDIENNWDFLHVYPGNTAQGNPAYTFTGTLNPQTLSFGTDCVTLVFESDGSVTDPGFAIQLTCDAPNCADGIQNGDEVGIDCGGPDCPPCSYYTIDEELSLVTCDAELYDSGATLDYGDDENYTMTFCSDGTASCMEIVFNSIDIAFGDHLYVYDGADATGFLMADLTNTTFQTPIVSTTGCITLNFVSDGAISGGGFQAQLNCTDVCPTCNDGIHNGQEFDVDCGGPDCDPCQFIVMNGDQTAATCSTTVYDNGYVDDYSNNADDTLVICSDAPGECINLDFLEFDLEGNFDFLSIYEGDNVMAPLYGTFSSNELSGVVNAGTECLTLVFTSDGSVTRDGYEIAVSCACPSCDDGIQNGQEIGIDCGGPDCPDCLFNAISEGGLVTSCSTTLFDSGVYEDYDSFEDHTLTICSTELQDSLLVEFQSLAIGLGDHLYIHSGPDVTGELLADVSAAVSWDDLLVLEECVTFHFTSDDFGTSAGFEVLVSCVDTTIITGLNDFDELGIQVIQPWSKSELIVNFDGSQNLALRIYDAAGREVITRAVSSGELIDLGDIEKGLYALSLEAKGIRVHTQSLIITE